MLKCDKVRCRYLELKLINQLSTKLYAKSVFDSEKVCNAFFTAVILCKLMATSGCKKRPVRLPLTASSRKD